MLVGALLGLTLSAGVAPTSMAWGEDDAVPDTTASASSDPTSSSSTTETSASESSRTASSATPESSQTSQSPQITESSSADASDEQTASEESSVARESAADEESQVQTMGIEPLIVGVPDGATAPYVYWTVKDSSGNLVPGATFSLQQRTQFGWDTSNTRTVTDCIAAGCTVIDRDSDSGEFLAKWINNDNPGATPGSGATQITAGNRYRIQPVTAPSGYRWVSSTGWVDSNDLSWQGSGNTRTLDFGSFTVEKIQTAVKCDLGYIYAISSAGQLQQIAPGGAITNIGTSAGQNNMNGLGIGSGGAPVYATLRSSGSGTSQNATVWQFDTASGQWSSTGASTSSLGGNTGTNMIGGAVDLSSGLYYFGGFTSGGDFKVYEYDPSATPKIKLKATVQTTATSEANGDVAFDAAGNFYIVRGSGNQSIVYSVTKAAFQAANGGTVASSATNAFTTSSDVNGVAFDSSGKAFLGASSTLRSYDMPNWSNSTAVVNSGLSSTDLASCSSPPTIVIEKEIVGGRVNPGDQVKLTLKQGTTTLGEVTTTGSATGVQDQRIGPMPTVRSVDLSFTETAAGTTNLANYVSAYQCTLTYIDGSVQILNEVSGTSGSITIPTTGEAVRCVFRNAPLVASVNIHKDLADAQGENPVPLGGWTVGATATATGTETVTGTPTAATQQTNTQGNASWSFKFQSKSGKATVNVLEQMQATYAFHSGECSVTHIDGSSTTTDLTGPGSTALAGIGPGDTVDCTYVNKPAPGALTITKAFDSSVPQGSGTNVTFTGTYTCTLNSATVASGSWSRTGTGAATLTPASGSPAANQIPVGASCSATENTISGSAGLPNGSYQWGTATLSPANVTIATGKTSDITVTNKAERIYGNFSVTKVLATGSTADSSNQYSGDWSCSLGSETKTGTWGPIAAGGTWTSTVANQIPLGADCKVTSENRPDHPVADNPSFEWDGAADLGSNVTAAKDKLATVTVTNTTKQGLGSVIWTKVAAGTDGELLAGSTWTLTGPNVPANTVVTDCEATPCPAGSFKDQDPVAGAFLLIELPAGDYTLTEKSAPPGYQLVKDPISFTVVGGSTIELDPIENTQQDGAVLPLTGGMGRDAFLIGGTGLLLIAAGALVIRQRRMRRVQQG